MRVRLRENERERSKSDHFKCRLTTTSGCHEIGLGRKLFETGQTINVILTKAQLERFHSIGKRGNIDLLNSMNLFP